MRQKIGWILVWSLFFPFLCVEVLYAKDGKGAGERISLQIQTRGKELAYFFVRGKLPYPTNTILTIGLKYQLGKQSYYINWYRTVVDKKGGWDYTLKIVPSRQKLVVAGTYIAEVWFELKRQPLYLQETLRNKNNLPADFSAKLGSSSAVFGTKQEQAKALKEVAKHCKAELGKIKKIYQQLNAQFNWSDFANRKPPKVSGKDWRGVLLKLRRGFRQHRKELNKWMEGYFYLPLNQWCYELKSLARQIERLGKTYWRYFHLEKMSASTKEDKARKEAALRSWERRCKRIRASLERTFYRLEEEMDSVLFPERKKEENEDD
ncbi:MAG: hypothetical protein D6805_05365 [Planctomycetota bacterium]|nr:MAG: hypothetical protein D6805_05365 [Planctomycetota bacterium]